MAHVAYSSVGYIYNADQYCLDCIPLVIVPDRETVYAQKDGCNCTECVLDRIADDRNIDRYDEGSFDSSVFPKAIAYHNDLHSECEADTYSYNPASASLWSCWERCGNCGDVIDGYYNQCPEDPNNGL